MTENRLVKRLVLIGLVLLLAGLYVYGARQQLERANPDLRAFDQSAYMDFTRQARESGFTYTGDRNRMPIYPFLQALFYRPGMSDEALFRQGKTVNLILSLILLAALALIFRRFFNPLHVLVLTLIIAFTVFIFRAGWFQSELLFYFLNFCLFLGCWSLLRRPSYAVAAATGLVAGLAYLTKASILPGLVAFAACAVAQWLWLVLRRPAALPSVPAGAAAPDLFNPQSAIRNPQSASAYPQSAIRNPQSGWVYGAVAPLVLSLFLLTLSPYLSESKRVFGHYFYNVNSTFYLWYDSWEQAKQGTRAHGDRVGWPDMPADQLPSPARYLREHTPRQIAGRFVNGGREVLGNVLRSYGYAKYVLIYAGFLLAAIAWQRRRAGELIRRSPFLVAFLLLYFAAYFLLYSWYAAIAAGNRLILAQLIPLLFTLSMGLRGVLADAQVRIGRPLNVLTAVNLVVLAVLAVDIALVLIQRVGVMPGGS
jgi:hypothetical protein